MTPSLFTLSKIATFRPCATQPTAACSASETLPNPPCSPTTTVDQAAVETARSAVVDILEAGGLAQLGKAQTLGERGIVAFDGLAIDQHRQALVEAEAIAVGQALLLLERLGHAGEA